jgi:NADH-quinone oxidoreductase subunit E
MKDAKNMFVAEECIDKIINEKKGKPGELLSSLEEIQELNVYKFLPEKTLSMVSKKMGVSLSQIYSVVTFYSFFNLKPQGDHSIVVCRGTACHTKGSKALLDDVGLMLGSEYAFEEGESSYTTSDNQFTIKTVACFGQCALSPVVSVDGIIYSNMNSQKLSTIIKKIKGKGIKK